MDDSPRTEPWSEEERKKLTELVEGFNPRKDEEHGDGSTSA